MFNHNDPEPSFGIISPEVLDIPKECRECPQIRLLQERFDKMLLKKREFTDSSQKAMGELQEVEQEAEHEEIESRPSATFDPYEVTVDEILIAYKVIFKRYSHYLDETDEDIAEINETISSLTSSCDGALKMRAPKGNNTFTATICTSVTAPSECITEVDIKRTRK